MYIHFTGWLFHTAFPHMVWQKNDASKVIYLTFDDGPIPGVTEFVLHELEKYDAQATFFCVGDNIGKHPDIFAKVLQAGHRVGNHTFNHLNGWQTDNQLYLENVAKCQQVIDTHYKEPGRAGKKLFRPPHGRLKTIQSKTVREEYEIVMWSVLSGDFDRSLSRELCLNKTVRYTKPGAIVVFHDSLKAENNLAYALPRYLAHFSKQGYRFEKL